MLIPTKHQNLNDSLISIGSEILRDLKKRDKFIEDLFENFKDKHKNIHLDNFFLAIIFLWMIDSIKMEDSLLRINKKCS